MTIIYRCTLELHDSLYYATRELGRLYETEPVLHNYALCYALGLVDSAKYATTLPEDSTYCYFCSEQVPMYEVHLTPLNQHDIYVTPARAIGHGTVINTWKYADNRYHVEMQKTQKNIPSFGRAKEIAPESRFECFIISERSLTLPHWIRLGKWMSKAEVKVEDLGQPKQQRGEINCPYPLNPLDVMFTHRVTGYDVINMPPVSLIQNVKLAGAYYQVGDIRLPAQMSYRFSS
ncbi:MAG: type I-D CRISPR-associated protein Cas5/Csc1 [Cyanothece sp. SIO1E1]|nr:type I-D CRISPR-associated protein Cas5/Csc1 [Cyanothece sp. SIO1E1]